jgi:hypothetical protein
MKERNNKINTESFSEAVVLDPPSNWINSIQFRVCTDCIETANYYSFGQLAQLNYIEQKMKIESCLEPTELDFNFFVWLDSRTGRSE